MKPLIASRRTPESFIGPLVSFSRCCDDEVHAHDEQHQGDLTTSENPFLKILSVCGVVFGLEAKCGLGCGSAS